MIIRILLFVSCQLLYVESYASSLEELFDEISQVNNLYASKLQSVEYDSHLALNDDLSAQDRILNYFTERYEKGLFITLNSEYDILKSLKLEQWRHNTDHYHPIFVTLCVSKAINNKDWVIPHSVYEKIKDQANKNDAIALTNLGYLYRYGLHVKEDYNVARHHWQLAAMQGLAYAQCSLAEWLINGIKIPGDMPQALKLAVDAAEQGSVEGHFIAGLISQKQGNLQSSINHWKIAAKKGSIKALTELGILYEEGLYVEKNHKIAKKFYELAVQQKDLVGQYQLARLLVNSNEIEKDETRALELYQLSAEQQFVPAYMILAKIYEAGILGKDIDKKLALYYYKLAAHKGFVNAQEMLVTSYLSGNLGIFNIDKVVKWTLIGSQNGSLSLQGLFKTMFTKKVENDAGEETFLSSLESFTDKLKKSYGIHLLEKELNNPLGNANSHFKEQGLASAALYIYYSPIIKIEEKIIGLLTHFNSPGFLINSWKSEIKNLTLSLRGKSANFEQFIVDDATYLSFGKENVKHSKALISLLKEEDKDLKEALKAITILKEVFEQSIETLKEESNDPQTCSLIEEQEERLYHIREVKVLIDFLKTLVQDELPYRNAVFEKAYTCFN